MLIFMDSSSMWHCKSNISTLYLNFLPFNFVCTSNHSLILIVVLRRGMDPEWSPVMVFLQRLPGLMAHWKEVICKFTFITLCPHRKALFFKVD